MCLEICTAVAARLVGNARALAMPYRPRPCTCGKIRYPDEAAAEAAAERRRSDPRVGNDPWHVYKCPGTTSWHLATRGFRPQALKSNARIAAWAISQRGVISRVGLLSEFGLDTPEGRGSNAAKRLGAILYAFASLGLIICDQPRPGYVTAADKAGLLRVMAVGLSEYAAECGIVMDSSGRRR